MAKQRSFAFVVAFWTAVPIALAMAVFAVFQYFTLPDITLAELVAHHLWHVLALGAMIYVFCWVVFRRALVQPLHQIYLHLYKVGTGRLEPLELPSDIRELQTIVEGVNLMIRRMEQGFDPSAVEHTTQELAALRELAKAAYDSAPEQSGEIMERLANLEQSVHSIIHRPSESQAVPFAT